MTGRPLVLPGDRGHQLDDPETYRHLDRSEMGPLIAGLGDQSLAAWSVGRAWSPPAHFTGPERVVVVSMGGSAIGGDIAATIARRSSEIPIEVIRDYSAPPTTTRTLTIALSLSGDTEETLSAFREARAGQGLRMTISTGGRLSGFDDPHLPFHWPHPPRTGLGWTLFSLLGVLTRVGVLSLSEETVKESALALSELASRWGPTVAAEENGAKQLALRLVDQLPVVVGTEFLDVVARRWVGQIQENAKQWAFSAAIPEMNHNLLSGIGSPAGKRAQLYCVLLDSELADPRNRRRVALTGAELTAAAIPCETVSVGGRSTLETILRTSYLGDWVSYYLAMLGGQDPTPTPRINRFKVKMGDGEAGGEPATRPLGAVGPNR